MVRKALNKYSNLSVIAKASFWALFAGVMQKAVSVIATPVFTRLLTTEEYAQYTLYQSWQGIFRIFISLNVFNYATYTAMVKFEDDRNGFITSAQTLVTVLSLAGIGLYYIVYMFWGDIFGFSLLITVLMFLEIVFISSYNLWLQKKRYDYQYRIMTFVSVLNGVLQPVLGYIGVCFFESRGDGRIYGVVAANIGTGLILYIINICRSKTFFNLTYWKYIITFCLPLIPHFLSSQILSRFDRIMINQMCDTSDVAVYSLAYNVSTLMIIVSEAVLSAFTPYTYQCIKEGRKEEIKNKTTYTMFIVAVANLILILFAPEAVAIFAPKEYYEAIYIIPAVSGSVYFMFQFNIFANIEYYYSETKYVTVASIVAALTNIILNFIFIRMFGYIAAGYTTLVSYIVYSLGHYVFMQRVSRKYAEGYQFYDNKKMFLMSAGFIIVTFCVIPLYKLIFVRYILILGVCIVFWNNRKIIIEIIKNKQNRR